ncbi:DUF5011 domain-containing protein [Rhodocytophaga aerolata]|uniref:DUF5011 domain-containing protein n=1 Tax=Rhodocytophaga aerolata TaxID=455078 RepID=A0ABT8RBQ7_9BACT|nr:immunoglobulin-like domain-containing protein [Rhodocytophaga aerolata]MDO1449434.1 DUF5011 domain-containing protein [Rhodocytophaga aerolata]
MHYSLPHLLVRLLWVVLLPLQTYGQLPDDVPSRQQASRPAVQYSQQRQNVPGSARRLSAEALPGEIPNVNVSNLNGNESEVSISVNPTNRNNQVICAHAADFSVMNTFFTTDGGQTWTRVALGQAQDGNPATFRFDPTVAFAGDGNVYVAYGIDNGSNRDLVVARSTNGGASYDQFTIVDTEPSLDKWIIGTGPDSNTPNQFNVYLAYRINAGSNVVTRLASSYDQGATFPTDVLVTTTGDLNTFGMPAVGPNGEVYVVWDDQTNRPTSSDIRMAVSLDDGGTFSASRLVGTTAVTRNPTRYMIPAQPDRGVLAVPSIAVDRSGGPNNGRIYVAYTVVGGGGANDTDIIVRSSDNQGVNWSAPVTVNTDGGSNSQFLPWLDVDQITGQVVVVWYDARNDTDNQQVELFLGVSNNGGASFTNTLVSDNPSDQSTDNASRTSNNFLEYIGVASLNGVAFPVWADNSLDLSDLDIFTDQIPIGLPPVANAGPDQTIECAGHSGTAVTLDGSGSSDPNGDPLTYSWYEGATIIAGPTATATANVSLSPGVHVIRLEVNDGNLLTDSDEVTITIEDTTPPVITLNGASEIVLECGIDTYTELGATATDICDASVPVSISGTVDTHTPGTYLVTYNATDDSGNAAVEVVRTVKVVDTTPPVVTVLSAPTTLWSPNHKYFTLSLSNLTILVEDQCDTELSQNDVVITAATSDEQEDAKGGGDGATTQDIVISNNCRSVNLRAERKGGGNGRVYTIVLKVADASGNVGTTTYQVHVPHDKASGPLAVKDATQYSVTSSGCEPIAASAIAKAKNAIQAEEEFSTDFALEQNFPNPFRSQTLIRFTLPETTPVSLKVYNVLGQPVTQLINEVRQAGRHELNFDAFGLKSGTYLYLLEAGHFRSQKKMVIVP